jgi:hypothetical protein
MENERTCPKCLHSQKLEQFKGAVIVLPAAEQTRAGSKISDKGGLPIDVYRCPQCNFVELYAANF